MFNLSDKQRAEKIKNSYMPQTVEKTKIEELRELDAKVKRPANIFSCILGGVGSLVLGTGMCIAMGVVGGLMPVGIIVGLAGIGMVSVNYPIYKKILQKRKDRYSKEIIEKSNAIIECEEYNPSSKYLKNDKTVYECTENKAKTIQRDDGRNW